MENQFPTFSDLLGQPEVDVNFNLSSQSIIYLGIVGVALVVLGVFLSRIK